ncbi:MAG: thioredoxin fold domain-containing protein [Pseudomonadales bacterium]|nr:thioredoxin fold domain-containing protein [Pseudomonadales bacterium]NIX08085.1 thioredoxin fold domain-containing protein [Pseudomonadales bacterium]
MLFALIFAGVTSLVAPAKDLQQAARLASDLEVPIVLYVSRSDCSFCRRFEEDVLFPIIRSGEIDRKVLLRELEWDRSAPLDDFTGTRVSAEALARRYDAKLTPTLLFLDHHGNELISRMTGYRESDYASYNLEAAIDLAFQRMVQDNAPETRQ